MINRILIRTKVVQLLYSYLLTRSDFKIETAPDGSELSQDKQFAYRTYIDTLMLIGGICGSSFPGCPDIKIIASGEKKLRAGSVGPGLFAEDTLRQAIRNQAQDVSMLTDTGRRLSTIIAESSVFTDYKRKRNVGLAEEVQMWITILESIFAKQGTYEQAMRQLTGFTIAGFNNGIKMAVDTLKSFYGLHAGYRQALDRLDESLRQAYDLYHAMFALIVEITREQEMRIENAKNLHLATPEQRNPNTRFINNRFAAKLAQDEELNKYCQDHSLSWDTDVALINSLLSDITSSDIYKEYMDAPDCSYEADCEFWRQIMRNIILNNTELYVVLEDKSIFWNDDLPIIGTFVLKTIKQAELSPEQPLPLLPQYKDDEDAKFGAELFVSVIKNRKLYRSYIDQSIDSVSWDPERLAFMDIVIMMTALSELLNYPKIPVAVTMNEYVEIANAYSTIKSGQFVNGILYNIAHKLYNEGKLIKNPDNSSKQ